MPGFACILGKSTAEYITVTTTLTNISTLYNSYIINTTDYSFLDC